MQLSILPTEIILEILSYLKPYELVVAANTSKKWTQLSDSDCLWIEQCHRNWKNKQMHAGALSALSLSSRTYCHPLCINTTSNGNMPWKTRFIIAEKDAIRTEITKEELCQHHWRFTFKVGVFGNGMYQAYPVFTQNNELVMEHHGVMKWQFVENNKYVQVEQYPPLKPSRTSDWGWKLENPYVIFVSLPSVIENDATNHQEKRQHQNQLNLMRLEQDEGFAVVFGDPTSEDCLILPFPEEMIHRLLEVDDDQYDEQEEDQPQGEGTDDLIDYANEYAPDAFMEE